ncbi:MAG: PEP-CTERM sorting domain-containing protein [Luteolibacter sp.]|uniref:PEP-CTERM sorting domain-containing protein n=1 Tax=Luteolibacter sp. TaxID=1962973 RepID=UPI003265F19B
MMNLRTLCIFGIAFVAAADLAFGQDLSQPPGTQIGWASEAFATNYMADGVTTFEQAVADNGVTIRFELGTFATGFDPRTASQADWVANWIVLQGADYNTGDQQVIETATLSSNASPFGLNAQAYIWGFTSKDTDPESQWILLAAPAWKWPDANSPLPTTFSVSDAVAMDAITGSVNPGDGSYHMQFSYVAVPETSSALLAATAVFGLAWRRRR